MLFSRPITRIPRVVLSRPRLVLPRPLISHHTATVTRYHSPHPRHCRWRPTPVVRPWFLRMFHNVFFSRTCHSYGYGFGHMRFKSLLVFFLVPCGLSLLQLRFLPYPVNVLEVRVHQVVPVSHSQVIPSSSSPPDHLLLLLGPLGFLMTVPRVLQVGPIGFP